MEHDLRANAFFAFVAREGRYRFSLAEIMLESEGWGGTAFRRKAIPRWKRVLESNRAWRLFACSGRVWSRSPSWRRPYARARRWRRPISTVPAAIISARP